MDIEMPGQYMNGDEPSPDGIVFLEGISSNVHVGFMRLCIDVSCRLELAVTGPRVYYSEYKCSAVVV